MPSGPQIAAWLLFALLTFLPSPDHKSINGRNAMYIHKRIWALIRYPHALMITISKDYNPTDLIIPKTAEQAAVETAFLR